MRMFKQVSTILDNFLEIRVSHIDQNTYFFLNRHLCAFYVGLNTVLMRCAIGFCANYVI